MARFVAALIAAVVVTAAGYGCNEPGVPISKDGATDSSATSSVEAAGAEPTDERSKVAGCEPPAVFKRYGSRTEARVALTFDDAPGARTLVLAKLLSDNDARATFFVLASRIDEAGAGALRRLVADGNELGSHSYSHPNLIDEPAKLNSEIRQANDAIEEATGFKPCLFRFPFGKLTPQLVEDVAAAGMMTVGWDVDPSDWKQPGATAITGQVLEGVQNGSIVVMHDSYETGGQTEEALPEIIRGLKARGFRIVTVSELLANQ